MLFWLVAVLSGLVHGFPTNLVGDGLHGARQVSMAPPTAVGDDPKVVLRRRDSSINNAEEDTAAVLASADLAQRSGNFGSRSLPRRVVLAKRRLPARPFFPRTPPPAPARNTTEPTEHINVVIASKQSVSAAPAPRRKEEAPPPTETQSSWYHYQNTPHDVQIVSVRVSTSVGKSPPQHPFAKLDAPRKSYAKLEPYNEVEKKTETFSEANQEQPITSTSVATLPPTEPSAVHITTTSEEPPSLPVPLPQVLLAENDDYAYRICDHDSSLCLHEVSKDEEGFGQKSRSSVSTQSVPSSYQTSHLSVDETSPPSGEEEAKESPKTTPTNPTPVTDTRTSPIVYHTRVSTQTSASTVTVYSKANVGSEAETMHAPVVMEAPRTPEVHVEEAQFGSTEAGPVAHHSETRGRYLHRATSTGTYQEYEAPDKSEKVYGTPERVYSKPEENYEVDEAVSVMTNGRAHGVQPQSTSSPPRTPSDEDAENKSGYVVEGRNFRKYRVEERTPDGFIVGEYGVVSHDDGSLRGVRYTADGTINPRLIYDALLKFLNL